MFVLFRSRTPLASSDLRSGSGNFLRLPGDLSTRESLEISLWFTAHPPAFQTVENLSLCIIVWYFGVSGEFSFLLRMFLDICPLGDYWLPAPLLSLQRLVHTIRHEEEPQNVIFQSLSPSPASAPSALHSPLPVFVIHCLKIKNPPEGFFSSHPECWKCGQTYSMPEVPWGYRS